MFLTIGSLKVDYTGEFLLSTDEMRAKKMIFSVQICEGYYYYNFCLLENDMKIRIALEQKGGFL